MTYDTGRLLRELNACMYWPNATNGGPTVFSGWYVPDWLMQYIRAALEAAEADRERQAIEDYLDGRSTGPDPRTKEDQP